MWKTVVTPFGSMRYPCERKGSVFHIYPQGALFREIAKMVTWDLLTTSSLACGNGNLSFGMLTLQS